MALIVDLTTLSAVYAARLLAEAGHDVVRVEPRHGDALRRMGPSLAASDQLDLESGAYHVFYNAGKRSITPDLATISGREVLTRLLGRADALLVSLPLPYSEAEIRAANAGLVMVKVQDDEPELVAYARSGLLSITGQPEEEPSVLGAHMVYAATGLYVAMAAFAALHSSQQSGIGQVVEVSVAQCMESLMEQPMVGYVTAGTVAERRGYRGAITAVSGAFPCKDGYWMISVPHGADGWARFIDWVQDPELAADTSLVDERERLKKRDMVLDRLTRWSVGHTKEELVEEAQRRHIPASPVATALELVDDPQLTARGFLAPAEHPILGSTLMPVGALASLTHASIGAAPSLGQHNAEVLTELGYSAPEQRALLESGAI